MLFVAANNGIVSRVASKACRLSIVRLWRAAVSNLRIACVAVSNLGIWGPCTRPTTMQILCNGCTLIIYIMNFSTTLLINWIDQHCRLEIQAACTGLEYNQHRHRFPRTIIPEVQNLHQRFGEAYTVPIWTHRIFKRQKKKKNAGDLAIPIGTNAWLTAKYITVRG